MSTSRLSIQSVVALVLVSVAAPPALADFEFPEFEGDLNLSLLGSAFIEDGALVLTPDEEGQSGGAWVLQPVVLANGFETSFIFRIGGQGGLFGLGDGMALVIQNQGAYVLGGGGGDLGYGGLEGVGIAVEIDTWPAPDDEVSVQGTRLDRFWQVCFLSAADRDSLEGVGGLALKDGELHQMTIRYDGARLDVHLDGSAKPIVSVELNLSEYECDGESLLDGKGAAWIGFTAGTGGAKSSHEVRSWSFVEGAPEPACTTIPGGPAAAGCLALNGDAKGIAGGGVRLTAAEVGQRGSAWLEEKQALACGFDTTFVIRLESGFGGADGMAFVIQNQGLEALGGGGSGMGYGFGGGGDGIPGSLAVEIDTFAFGGEFPADHISIQSAGAGANSSDDAFSLGHFTLPFDINDGQERSLRVRYRPGTMEVFVDGRLDPDLTVAVDLTNVGGADILDGDGAAWIGFTAGTGGLTQAHDVVAWSFQSLAAPLGDLDGDCLVGGSDLGILLGAWGRCSGCAADLTGDGEVGGADLGVLLGNWS